jgi:hypothetical protein
LRPVLDQGAPVLAAITDLVAIEEFEDAGMVGESGEGEFSVCMEGISAFSWSE